MSNTTRSWRSVEDGCITITVHRLFRGTIVAALDQLETQSDDSAIVSVAKSLALRLKDFEVILAIYCPASRILQSVAVDMSQE